MANLLIDIGNTALKASWADGMTLGKTFRYQGERMLDFILSLTAKEKPEKIILSSVRYFSEQNVERLSKECGKMIILDSDMLEQEYAIPAYLTPDRAASVIAARYLFKNRPCTIFDFGTTFTIDFLDKDGNFEADAFRRDVIPGSDPFTGIRSHFLCLMLRRMFLRLVRILYRPLIPVSFQA